MLDPILALYRVEYAAKDAGVLSTEQHLALRRAEQSSTPSEEKLRLAQPEPRRLAADVPWV